MGCILKGGGGLYSRVVVGAVLLAAGQATRMGNRPKSLLQLGGVPLIRRQLIALSGAGVDEVVVVLGHYADDIEPLLQEFPVTIVRNPAPSDGQVSSLRCGLAGLTGKLDAVVVALADQPLINAQDISALIAAYKKRPDGAQVVQPAVGDAIGNPVMFSEEGREGKVYRWATDNKRYITDVDSPEDLARFTEQTGHQLSWPPAWVPVT